MRNHLDFYETPEWQVKALLNRVGEIIKGSIFEPCVGDGSISRFLPGEEVFTNDIDTNREAQTHFDATLPGPWKQNFDWTITNPPFNSALPILKNAIEHSRVGVIMLLRITFLEPTKERGPFLSIVPPTKQLVLPRWSYKRNGSTDSATTAWFFWTWTKGNFGQPIEVVTQDEQRKLMAK